MNMHLFHTNGVNVSKHKCSQATPCESPFLLIIITERSVKRCLLV